MEILKFIFQNAERLGASDLLLLLAIAACCTGCGIYLIHWIYKHAFDKQKEVIKSQDQLISLKEKAIADYQKRTLNLEEEKQILDNKLSQITHDLLQSEKKQKELSEKQKSDQMESIATLLHCAHLAIAINAAQIILSRLRLCSDLRYLARVYAAVCAEKKDFSGPHPLELYDKVDSAIAHYIDRLSVIRSVDHLHIPKSPEAMPPELKKFVDEKNEPDRAHEAEDFLLPKILPFLERYEPNFATKVSQSYKKRLSKH